MCLDRRYHLTRVNRWSDCIGYRIKIVCLIGTLSTILLHSTHTMKLSDPLLLALALCTAGCILTSSHPQMSASHLLGLKACNRTQLSSGMKDIIDRNLRVKSLSHKPCCLEHIRTNYIHTCIHQCGQQASFSMRCYSGTHCVRL